MKKLLLLLFFIPSIVFANEYSTNIPNVFIKNYQCKDGLLGLSFNIVNKSSQSLLRLTVSFFDKDGDPVDNIFVPLSLKPNSGQKYDGFSPMKCQEIDRITFEIDVFPSPIEYSPGIKKLMEDLGHSPN